MDFPGLTVGVLELVNRIVADNVGTTHQDCRGSITSLGHNLVEDVTGCTFNSDTGDLVAVDPMLVPLQNNGGVTQTHALLPGSPAIVSGDDVSRPPTTQRGGGGPQGGGTRGRSRQGR